MPVLEEKGIFEKNNTQKNGSENCFTSENSLLDSEKRSTISKLEPHFLIFNSEISNLKRIFSTKFFSVLDFTHVTLTVTLGQQS